MAIEQTSAPFFSPQGRLGRVRWLAHISVANLIVFGPMAAAFVFGRVDFAPESPASHVALALAMAWLWHYSVVSIQRSHDIGWPAWTALIALIPLVNLVWLFAPGQGEGNAYGPPPKANTTGVWCLALITPAFVAMAVALAIIALPYAGRVFPRLAAIASKI